MPKKNAFISLILVLCLLSIGGCAGSGGYGNIWIPRQNTQKAESKPGDLVTEANATKTEAEDSEFPLTPWPTDNTEGAPEGIASETDPSAFSNPNAVKVGILLPLSGENRELGNAMLNAAQMALFDVGVTNFELVPRDTGNSPAGAAKAANEAINDGAKLLIGPIFAKSAAAVKPIAERNNVNMISFSTDWTLAGGNSFIMGILPFGQVQRIAEYASGKGYRKVGIIAPDDAYGNVVIQTFREYANLNGIEIVKISKFNPMQKDLSSVVASFAGDASRLAGGGISGFDGMNDNVQLPFDAVLIPAGGDQARAISSLLTLNNLPPEKVKRLGTGLWDDAVMASDNNMNEAWFSAPSPKIRKKFEDRFRSLYGQTPPRLSSIAYDATALAAVLTRSAQSSGGLPAFDRNSLINPNGYSGMDGIFRFRPDGMVERGLSVLEFRNGRINEIDSAPSTFQVYGGT